MRKKIDGKFWAVEVTCAVQKVYLLMFIANTLTLEELRVCSRALEHLEGPFSLENSSYHVLSAPHFSNQGNVPSFDEIIQLWLNHRRIMKPHCLPSP